MSIRYWPEAPFSEMPLPTHKGRMLFSTADSSTSITSLKKNDSC